MKWMGHMKDADQALAFKLKVGKLSSRIWVDCIFSEKGGQILGNKGVIWLAAKDRQKLELPNLMWYIVASLKITSKNLNKKV